MHPGQASPADQVPAVRRVGPPSSWLDPHTHFLAVLENSWYRGLVRLQDAVTVVTTRYWADRGVRNLHLPVTTGSISSPMGRGSDSTPVLIDLMGVPTYLADSMQFMLEIGCRLCPDGAYYLMPSFRGEAADETHLSQFFHSEAEIPGDLDDVVAAVEDYLRFLIGGLLEREADTIRQLTGGRIDHLEAFLARPTLERLTFDEVVKLLGDTPEFFSHQLVDGVDVRSMTRLAEREIIRRVGEFTWVTHMDHLSVPFYQAFDPTDRGKAMNGDLLFGVGETVGCGMRHATADTLLEALDLHGVERAEYDWYVTMRERVPLQTSGFGMGVERFLLWALDHHDIRDMATLLRFNGIKVLP